MELDRYYELRIILQRWLRRLADNFRARIEENHPTLERLEDVYHRDGIGEEFTLWLDRWCRQAAIQFILRILFIRVLEDRNLLGTIRLRNSDGQQMWYQLTRNMGVASYIKWCWWDAAHLLPDLFDPNDYDLILPADDLVKQFLDDVWRRPDANQSNWLRYDFRPNLVQGDSGFQTRFIGDLYQELDSEIRERYALLQTPHFIFQFILAHTLLKCFTEKDFRKIKLIDPTCGSAHFLVDAFWLFVAEYEQILGKSHAQLSSVERAKIARTIIEKHLHGCDINPYATALARFRLLLAACDYAQPVSLQDFRDLHFNIVTIDSLIPYEKNVLSGFQTNSYMAKIYGQVSIAQRAASVLRNHYDVVVGNPPYITTKDEIKRDLYREYYTSAHGTYGLSAPFTERFFQLASSNGYVGLINSSAFLRRQFGKKLIEEVLPQYEIQAILDLGGAYIPGHGTPTFILLGRKRTPTNNEVVVVSNIKGEVGVPKSPDKGQVWLSVQKGFASGEGFADEFIEVEKRSRQSLGKHPWQFGGTKSRLDSRIRKLNPTSLSTLADAIGFDVITGADELFIQNLDVWRRVHAEHPFLRSCKSGESLRDWVVDTQEYIFFPYNDDLTPLETLERQETLPFFKNYKEFLENRRQFGKTAIEAGLKWFEYRSFYTAKRSSGFFIAFSEIASHNHFIFSDEKSIFPQTAPVIKLKDEDPNKYLFITALLNSSVTAFILKQSCYNKGTGKDPIRDRYVYSSTYVGTVPVPVSETIHLQSSNKLLRLSEMMLNLSEQLSSLASKNIFSPIEDAYFQWNSKLEASKPNAEIINNFSNTHSLYEINAWMVALREDIRQRMIFLQEEIDWLTYEMYGLIDKAPTGEEYLTPKEYEQARLQLGQRAFELVDKGYQGDWLPGYQPDRLPSYLHPLTEARITLIQSNPDIALLEDPLYKRRWIPIDYDLQFREAARWWLSEKLEYEIENYGRPITLKQWAQLLRTDERVNATLEILTGSPMFDLEQELQNIVKDNAVPNRPEHYLKASGLRLLKIKGELKSTDFSDPTAWRLRGKLNIPRERFIAYKEFDHTWRGNNAPDSAGPWFGWAGWNTVQRAEALAYLLDQANRVGWEVDFRQCGLRAALRDLLPELRTILTADEVLEFADIAQICGIGLETRCYCRAYYEGITAEHGQRPGAPGVTLDAINSLSNPTTLKKRKQSGRTRAQANAEQLAFTLPTSEENEE